MCCQGVNFMLALPSVNGFALTLRRTPLEDKAHEIVLHFFRDVGMFALVVSGLSLILFAR
jgi:hypothetical protein